MIVFKGLLNTFLPVIYLAAACLILLLGTIKPSQKPSMYHFAKYVLPLILVYIFYRIIDYQITILQFPVYDYLFYNLEHNVLGMYPSFALQRVMEVWLNEASFLFYTLGIFFILYAILFFYRKALIDEFENFIFAIVLGSLICLTVISVLPVQGPGRALEDYFYLNIHGPRFSAVLPFLLKIVTPNVGTFPSIYFCVLTISSYYLWDYGKSYIVVSFIVLTAVFWAGVYLRFHYLLDALAALIVAFLASTVAGFVFYLKHGRNIQDESANAS